jgi:hypothetical protein
MGRTTNGANLGQYANTSSSNAQWAEEWSGSYVKFRNRGTGLYIDGMGYTANGSVCGQWRNSGSYNQQWSQESISGGYYKFRNRATGLCLDGMGRTANGSDVGQYASGGSYNQQFSKVAPKSLISTSLEAGSFRELPAFPFSFHISTSNRIPFNGTSSRDKRLAASGSTKELALSRLSAIGASPEAHETQRENDSRSS